MKQAILFDVYNAGSIKFEVQRYAVLREAGSLRSRMLTPTPF
jgi:hypothetical protein